MAAHAPPVAARAGPVVDPVSFPTTVLAHKPTLLLGSVDPSKTIRTVTALLIADCPGRYPYRLSFISPTAPSYHIFLQPMYDPKSPLFDQTLAFPAALPPHPSDFPPQMALTEHRLALQDALQKINTRLGVPDVPRRPETSVFSQVAGMSSVPLKRPQLSPQEDEPAKRQYVTSGATPFVVEDFAGPVHWCDSLGPHRINTFRLIFVREGVVEREISEMTVREIIGRLKRDLRMPQAFVLGIKEVIVAKSPSNLPSYPGYGWDLDIVLSSASAFYSANNSTIKDIVIRIRNKWNQDVREARERLGL
ncbi:hypothetical protein JCM10207_007509 [Rhodosporidiobolus poonsookiae]